MMRRKHDKSAGVALSAVAFVTVLVGVSVFSVYSLADHHKGVSADVVSADASGSGVGKLLTRVDDENSDTVVAEATIEEYEYSYPEASAAETVESVETPQTVETLVDNNEIIDDGTVLEVKTAEIDLDTNYAEIEPEEVPVAQYAEAEASVSTEVASEMMADESAGAYYEPDLAEYYVEEPVYYEEEVYYTDYAAGYEETYSESDYSESDYSESEYEESSNDGYSEDNWYFDYDTEEWYYSESGPRSSEASAEPEYTEETEYTEEEYVEESSNDGYSEDNWYFDYDTEEWYYSEDGPRVHDDNAGWEEPQEVYDEADSWEANNADEESYDDGYSEDNWYFDYDTEEWYYSEDGPRGHEAPPEPRDEPEYTEEEYYEDDYSEEEYYEDDYSEEEYYEDDYSEEEYVEEYSLGQQIVDYALGFVGVTPYVAAGRSLYGGTDCSGFVSLIYADFGIYCSPASLAYDGSSFGYIVGYDEAQPGDIAVYGGGSHVAIYAGNGMVVHCSSPENGTVYWDMNYRSDLSWFLRVL